MALPVAKEPNWPQYLDTGTALADNALAGSHGELEARRPASLVQGTKYGSGLLTQAG